MEQRLPFPQQLRYERERRSWTQADIASKVGSDTKTVARWERGEGLPRAYHRQALCELFGKDAEELGLIKERSGGELPQHPILREDWGEAPFIVNFYGRDRELTELKREIEGNHCRVVAVLGIGGVGKTAFAAELAEQLKDAFAYIFWRSLQDIPPLEHVLKHALQFISGQQHIDLPEEVDDQLSLLIRYLRDHHCLFVLDNVESVMQTGRRVGPYREGYENYGRLIQRIGESQHQSCLLLTSREKPREVAYLEGQTSPVRSLQLVGLGLAEGRQILKDKGLFGSDEQWTDLVNRYSGNPLALKLIAQFIQEVFGGDIGRFLEQEETAFGDINELLDQQFHRLSSQEQEILYWLAIEREAMSPENIHASFVPPISKGALLEALNSLQRRSLIETAGRAGFTLQPVIMEYVTKSLVRRVYKEFATETASLWTNYAFIKAQTKDYVRENQRRLILAPIAERLLSMLGKETIEQKLKSMLAAQRQRHSQQRGYFAGNALNLLIHLQCDLRGFDFSRLVVRQAYLQHVALPGVDFAHAHFVTSVFTETFGNILAVSYNRQGDLFAAGTATGEILIYQALSATPLLTCHGHTDGVWSVAFNPDGHLLASGSDDQTVRVWEVSTGRCLKTLQEHTNRVRSVAFSSDGHLLASGSDDQTVRVWEVSTGQCLALLQGHAGRIWSVAFSSDGCTFASGSTDQSILLWNIETGQRLQALQGHTNWVRSITFSPDGHLLASGSDDQTIRLWDVETGHCLTTLQGHSNRVWSVTFSPDGHTLASGSEDQTVRLWSVDTSRYLKMLHGHTQGVRSVTFSPDGGTLASGGDDQCLRLWDIRASRCLKTLQGYTNRVWSIAFSPDGSILASGGEDQTVCLWEVSTGHCLQTWRDPTHGVRSVAFSPDGSILASGGEDQTVRLWEVSTGHCLQTLQGHTNWIRSVAFSPDGSILASGGEDQTVRLWEASTGHCLRTLQGHTNWIRSVAFSLDASILASGGDDQVILLWDVETGECRQTLQGHTNRVRSVAFSSDGHTLASGSEDQTIRLWDVGSGRCSAMLQGHANWVRSVTFSPDGSTLASSSDDQTLRLWNVHTGHCLSILQGHGNRVRSAIFSPDGGTLASGGDDGTVKLWDVQSSECIKTFISERPYEHMNISNIKGLTEAQKDALRTLGALER